MDKLSGWISKITKGNDNSTPVEKSTDAQPAQKTKAPAHTKSDNSSPASKFGGVPKGQQRPAPKPKTAKTAKPARRNNKHSGGRNNRNATTYDKNGKPEINVGRLKYERKSATTPSQAITQKSGSTYPAARQQRPRPMLGNIHRQTSSVRFPMYEKLPEGSPMRIIPLGGLNEVGKNSMAIEFEKELLIIDIGLQFPEENMPGVDYLVPDLSYLIERKEHIKGLLITHGHLDHIGGIHHYIEDLGFPTIYATGLTRALIEKRLEEHDLNKKVEIITINPDRDDVRFQLGKFTIDYFRVSHSIPDATGIFIKTEAGSMVHTGDFKFDFTPVDGMHCDYAKMTQLAKEGVDLTFADSTNALKEGYCPSERVIANNIEQVFQDFKGKRIIMATFASSIGRLQAIITAAVKNGRKIFLGGRSMNDNVRIAHDLNIITVPRSAIRKLSKSVDDYRPEEVLILTTGSQGEPFAALSRISRDEHPHIKISSNDLIVFSSSPIPGNERGLYSVIDAIYRKGATVHTKVNIDIHASGHGYRGDMTMMHTLLQSKYVVPIHGEYFMRIAHRDLAIKELGYEERNVIMLENGGITEVRGGVARRAKEQLKQQLIFVDGKSHADIKEKQVHERIALAAGGMITILLHLDKETKQLKSAPKLYSEGFLDNKNVNGVIIDTVKTKFAKLHQKFGAEKLSEKIITEDIAYEVKLEMLREIAREPVIQVLVILG